MAKRKILIISAIAAVIMGCMVMFVAADCPGGVLEGQKVAHPTNCSVFQKCFNGNLLDLPCSNIYKYFDPCIGACTNVSSVCFNTNCGSTSTPSSTSTASSSVTSDSTSTTASSDSTVSSDSTISSDSTVSSDSTISVTNTDSTAPSASTVTIPSPPTLIPTPSTIDSSTDSTTDTTTDSTTDVGST